MERRDEESAGTLERFRAKWVPVRVKKTRQNKRLEPFRFHRNGSAAANQIGAFFRESSPPKPGFGRRRPAGRQPIGPQGAPLSFFGTANGKTDAKNPQVN
jgi:hypothetical protein